MNMALNLSLSAGAGSGSGIESCDESMRILSQETYTQILDSLKQDSTVE